jgi:integrase
MDNFKEKIEQELITKKSTLSQGSVKTYVSNLYSIHKKLNSKDYSLDWFSDNYEEILDYIKSLNVSKQSLKTYLSGLYVLTGIKSYRDLMLIYCNDVNNDYKTQRLNQKQLETRISFQDVENIYNELLYNVLQNPTSENYTRYMACSLSSGCFFPPRRSEISNIKIKNYDKERDNYLLKNKIYFNAYKTVAKYGPQILIIPKNINIILKKYLKINNTDYLFPIKNGERSLNNGEYTRLLNSIFGKSISVDALRSIYLSNKYKDVPKLEAMQQIAVEMGHTLNTCMNCYVKK